MRKTGLITLMLIFCLSLTFGFGTMNLRSASATDIAADSSKWATIAASATDTGLKANAGASYARLTQAIPMGTEFEYTFKGVESSPSAPASSWMFIALSDIPEIDTNTHNKDSIGADNFMFKLTWCSNMGFNTLNYITAGAEEKLSLADGDLKTYFDGNEHVQKFVAESTESGWTLVYYVDGVEQVRKTFTDGKFGSDDNLYFQIRVSGGSAGYELSNMSIKAPAVPVELEKDYAASASYWSATGGQLSVENSRLTVGPGPYGVKLNDALDTIGTFGYNFSITADDGAWPSFYLGNKSVSDGATTNVTALEDENDFYIQVQFNKQWNVFKVLYKDKNSETEVKNIFNDVNDVFGGATHRLEYKTELTENGWKFTISVDGVALCDKTLENGALEAADGLYFSMVCGGTSFTTVFSEMGNSKKSEPEVLPESRYEGADLAAEITNWAQAGATVDDGKLIVKSAALVKLNTPADLGGEIGFAFKSLNLDDGINNNWNFFVFGNKSYANNGAEKDPSVKGDYLFQITLHDGFYTVTFKYFDTELREESVTTNTASTYNFCDGKAHVLYVATEKVADGYKFVLNIDGNDEFAKTVGADFAKKGGLINFTAYTSSGGSNSGMALFNCGMKEAPIPSLPEYGEAQAVSTEESNWIKDAYADDITFGESSITFNSFGATVSGANNNAGLALSQKISKESKITLKFKASVADQKGCFKVVFADMKNPMDARAIKYWESLFEHVALEISKDGVFLWNYNDAETGKQNQLPVVKATDNYFDANEHTLEISMAGSPDSLRIKIVIDETVHYDSILNSDQYNRKSTLTIGMASNDEVKDSVIVSDIMIAQNETTDDDQPTVFNPEDRSNFTGDKESNLLATENWQTDPFYDAGMEHDKENGTLEFKVFGDGGNHQCYAYKTPVNAGSELVAKFAMNVFDPYGAFRMVFLDLNGKADGQSVTPWNPLREVYTLEVSPTGMLSIISFKIEPEGTSIHQSYVVDPVKTSLADGNIHAIRVKIVPVYDESGVANGIKVSCIADETDTVLECVIDDARYIAKNILTVAGYSSNITHDTENVIKVYYIGAERNITVDGLESEDKAKAEKLIADIFDLEQNITIYNFNEIKDSYATVKTEYDGLTDEVKAKIYNYGYLLYVGNKIGTAEEDLKPVNDFIAMVDALPGITEDNLDECKTEYEKVIAAYRELTDTQKSYVSAEAESRITSYKGNIEKTEETISDKNAAKKVIDLIDALDETVTKENYESLKTAAEAAEKRFNSLTYNQKTFVTNYKKLKTVLKAISEFDVNAPDSSSGEQGCFNSISGSFGIMFVICIAAVYVIARKYRAKANR